MIFGRKKRQQAQEDADLDEQLETADSDLAADDTDTDTETDTDSASENADSAVDEEESEEEKWAAYDRSRDWREDGPFDISEVDLDADDVERMDFGSLILTPFDGMGMQLQMNKETGKIQAVLVSHGQSAIEIALFAAPKTTSLLPEVRKEMLNGTRNAGGTATCVKGPFGTEIRRLIPMQTKDNKKAYHLSKTWFAEGPSWLLRGVVMGQAGISDELEGTGELLYEFFSNVVVRRDDKPRIPGETIPLDLPEGLKINVNQPSE